MGRKEETLAEIERLRQTYGTQGAWARANATHPVVIASVAPLVAQELRTAATTWHTEARRLRAGPQAAQAYALAESAYTAYADAFPDAPDRAAMRYGQAELLYAVKKYDRAYDAYMEVVRLDPKGEHARFCAESAIFAAEALVEQAATPSGPAAATAPVPLGPWESKELAALDQYAALFADAKTPAVIYKSAYLLYNHNQFRDASERFHRVIALEPRSHEAEQAADLVLDSLALVEDWESLKKEARFFHDEPNLGSAAFKKEVYGLYENASLEQVEAAFATHGDKARAADDYLAFYREFPDSPHADLALNDACVYLDAVGRADDARAARNTFVTRFPASRFYPDQLAALGFAEESQARFALAAQWYERLAAVAPGHPAAPDALYSAAVFRGSLGEWEAAVHDYQAYRTSWPTRANVAGVMLDIARLYEEHQRWPEAAALYAELAQKPPSTATVDEQMYARLHQGLLLDELGQSARSDAFWKDTLAWYTEARVRGATTAVSDTCAAQILFLRAEPAYQAYLALPIDGPGDRKLAPRQIDGLLRAQLLAKVRAMNEIERTYTAVMGTGSGEWGLAALARIGAAYENLSATLAASYVPTWLTEEQQDLYRMGIADMIFAQNDKAATAYSAALQRSHTLSVYTADTETAARRLGVLRPDEDRALLETIPDPRFAAPSTFTGGFEPNQ
jgi:tetratricopeptide (TPR) repeat protein